MNVITRKEACMLYKMSLKTLDKMLNNSNISAKIKIGNKVLICRDDFEKILETYKT